MKYLRSNDKIVIYNKSDVRIQKGSSHLLRNNDQFFLHTNCFDNRFQSFSIIDSYFNTFSIDIPNGFLNFKK